MTITIEVLEEALDRSIEKWEKIERGETGDGGAKDCALCSLFYKDCYKQDPSDCVGCPVRLRTGLRYCRNTPYSSWAENTVEEKCDGSWRRILPSLNMYAKERELAIEAAHNMVELLKSLRPDLHKTLEHIKQQESQHV